MNPDLAMPRRRRAPRTPLLLVASIVSTALILAALSAVVLPAVRDAAVGPVYSVAELNRQVTANPRVWMGRTVRVEGVVVSYRTRSGPGAWQQHFVLVDARGSRSADRLSLRIGPADSLLAFLRRLPIAGALAGRAPDPGMGVPAIYRVQLQPSPSALCPACYQAVLRDTP